MPNLSIKNVPEPVVEKLRQRAAANHRSLQGELMALVCQAAQGDERMAPPRPESTGTRTIEEIAAEHRSRWTTSFDRAPRARDVIRADRDAR